VSRRSRRTRREARLTERAFHAWVARRLPAGRVGPLPLGDDAAALPLSGSRVTLLTSDALVEGTHFLSDSPPDAVGAAAVAASLSDLAAKGGEPLALLIDLLLPRTTPPAWPRSVLLGAERTAARFGAHVVGGDTKPAPRRVVVGIAVGRGEVRRLAPRSGARPGDRLVATGTVGRGGAAAVALGPTRRPTRSEMRELLDIRPRVAEGRRLAARAHAMLDTSDGIAEAAHLLAEASRVRVVLRAEDLPLDPALVRRVRDERRRSAVAFYGGDYELLAAVPSSAVASLRSRLARIGTPLHEVGCVERGRGAWLERNGRRSRLPRAGWQPFARER
jgi:thiamine-monophosphate kinase